MYMYAATKYYRIVEILDRYFNWAHFIIHSYHVSRPTFTPRYAPLMMLLTLTANSDTGTVLYAVL